MIHTLFLTPYLVPDIRGHVYLAFCEDAFMPSIPHIKQSRVPILSVNKRGRMTQMYVCLPLVWFLCVLPIVPRPIVWANEGADRLHCVSIVLGQDSHCPSTDTLSPHKTVNKQWRDPAHPPTPSKQCLISCDMLVSYHYWGFETFVHWFNRTVTIVIQPFKKAVSCSRILGTWLTL